MESRINPPTEGSNRLKRRNAWIYIVIIVLLLATNIYLFLQRKNNQNDKQVITEELHRATAGKDSLQNSYNAALARLDNLTSENSTLRKQLEKNNSDIQQLKNRITGILSKSNATKAELEQARNLILGLNQKISSYELQIAQLKHQNTTLNKKNDSVVSQNRSLQKQISVAKILHASNIRLIPINLRRSGRKESITEKARKVDLLRVSFDIDENLLAESGIKEFDIRIVNPDGILLTNRALGSGSFIDSNGKTQEFSVSKKMPLDSGIPLKGIDVDWRQADSYIIGFYIVEIYYQGHLIGQGTSELR